MPISLRLDFPNNSLADHDSVVEALNWPGDWPDGAIAHSAYEVEGHLVVTDVWESRQHFDRFVEQRLRQAMSQALGDRASDPADIFERELHDFSSREHGRS
jgi:hypothetical protein